LHSPHPFHKVTGGMEFLQPGGLPASSNRAGDPARGFARLVSSQGRRVPCGYPC
jgi:hypothetical protein